MSFDPIYDRAVTQPVIDGKPFGDELNPSRVTLLGDTPGQIMVKIYVAGLIDEENPEGGYRWLEADSITDATVTAQGNTLLIEGTSQFLLREPGLVPGDATMQYVVSPKGCASCR